MGGLVTKSCVKHYNKQRIDKIVFIGTPHLGAPKLYYAMLTGDTELGWFSDLVVRNKVIRDITRNFPSTYQLFPSSEYFLNNPFSLVKLQYSPFSPLPYFESLNYSDGIRFFKEQKTIWGDEVFNNGLIDLSQSVQSDLKQIDFGDIELYNIVGYGNSCIGHVIVNYYAGIRTSVDPIYSLDGDETVPLQSAETINQTVHSAKNTFYVSGADHSGLPSNGEVLNIIQNVLQIPPISVTKPKPMNYSYNALNIWQTLVACPVEVHVYDAAGRHTGPTSDSTYVEEIPGSRYLPANLSNPESKKVFLLPKGGSYRFEISSQDTSGFFDFRAYEIVNGKLVKFVSFDSVEFEPSTLAECVLRTISPDVAITVDKDGDGDIDSTYHTKAGTPTSVAENEKTEIPKDFILYQNYPNPFNNRTTIKFDLPRSEYVTLELYNASGQRILTLLNGSMHAGRHEVTVDASTLSSGVYLCRLRAGQSARTIKIGLIR
jgi:hypothetical protein